MLDMERRLRPVRAASFALLGGALLVSGPWLGFWTLIPLAVAVVAFGLVDRTLSRFRRPELALAGAWVLSQVVIAASVVLSGGAESPAVAWLAIPVVTLGARFTERGVLAGVVLTGLLMVAVTLGADPALVADEPWRLAIPLAMLGAIALLSTALMRSDLDHRTESVLDGLTGMLNRRALAARTIEIEQQARLTAQPLGVVVGDLDRFKQVNDQHGHAMGDAVLVDVAYTMRKELRAYDLAYRLGGEEFLVLLPGASLDATVEVAERLREAIARATAGGLDVTMSFGTASGAGAGLSVDALIADADAALYRAKAAGRDRVGTPFGAAGVPAAA